MMRFIRGNPNLLSFVKLLLAFVLGAGTAVAAAYNTFETIAAHDKDRERIEDMLKEIRGDVKTLLERTPPRYQLGIPKTNPPEEGYDKPPRPLQQAGG